MPNGKPRQLFPLLKAVGHPLGQEQKDFEDMFCGGGYAKVEGKSRRLANGSTNEEDLHEAIQSHLLYMSKEQCSALPPQTREHRAVTPSAEYEAAHVVAMQHAIAMARKCKPSFEESEENNANKAALGAIASLRVVTSLAKVDATVAMVVDFLIQHEPVVVFTSFVEVATLVHSKLKNEHRYKGALFTGDTPEDERMSMVADFQSGRLKFFVGTFGAGGVGLTLTAASKVILLDRNWTPGEVHQAENRVHRIGQTRPVTSFWLTAFDVDRVIDSMLAYKHETAMRVLTACTTREAPNVSIIKWLKSRPTTSNASTVGDFNETTTGSSPSSS
jgi:Helicase conserved C-terminal domain